MATIISQRVPMVQGMDALKGWLLARENLARMQAKDPRLTGDQRAAQLSLSLRAQGALDEIAFFECDTADFQPHPVQVQDQS